MADIVEYKAMDGSMVKMDFNTVKRYLVRGKPDLVNEQELVFFMALCKARQLNPFTADCFLIKYTPHDPAAIIVSIHWKRAWAKAQKDYMIHHSGCIVKRDGAIIQTNGLVLDDDELVGGWFRGLTTGGNVTEHEVNLRSYIKRKQDGTPTRFWSKENQPSQIAKVAESQGLSKAWPEALGRMYDPLEIADVETVKAEPVKTEDEIKSEEILKSQKEIPHVKKVELTKQEADQDFVNPIPDPSKEKDVNNFGDGNHPLTHKVDFITDFVNSVSEPPKDEEISRKVNDIIESFSKMRRGKTAGTGLKSWLTPNNVGAIQSLPETERKTVCAAFQGKWAKIYTEDGDPPCPLALDGSMILEEETTRPEDEIPVEQEQEKAEINPELNRYDHPGWPDTNVQPEGNGGEMFKDESRLEKFRLSWLASMNNAIKLNRNAYYGILGSFGYSATTEVPKEYNEMRRVYTAVKDAGLLDSIDQ